MALNRNQNYHDLHLVHTHHSINTHFGFRTVKVGKLDAYNFMEIGVTNIRYHVNNILKFHDDRSSISIANLCIL